MLGKKSLRILLNVLAPSKVNRTQTTAVSLVYTYGSYRLDVSPDIIN